MYCRRRATVGINYHVPSDDDSESSEPESSPPSPPPHKRRRTRGENGNKKSTLVEVGNNGGVEKSKKWISKRRSQKSQQNVISVEIGIASAKRKTTNANNSNSHSSHNASSSSNVSNQEKAASSRALGAGDLIKIEVLSDCESSPEEAKKSSSPDEEEKRRPRAGRGGWRIAVPILTDEATGAKTYRDVTLSKVVGGGGDDEDQQFRCQLCAEVISESQIKQHVTANHTNLTECRDCGKRFASVGILNSHVRFVHDKEARRASSITMCPICKKPDVPTRVLRRHVWTHYSKEFIASTVVNREIIPYGIAKQFPCDHCKHSCFTKSELEKHVKTHFKKEKNADECKEPCPQCGKMVKDLRYHLRTIHPAEKRFLCTQCDKRFSTCSLLNKHKKWHNLQWACNLCPQRFAMKAALRRHINMHLDKRPYKCGQCWRDFTAIEYLKKHVKAYHSSK